MLYALRITLVVSLCIGMLHADVNTIESNKTMNSQKESMAPLQRPQEPKPPFPYRQEEVCYENKAAGITLAGTLTLPQGKGPFPVLLIISGMGPNTRNPEFAGHKPLLVLADHFTRKGIATLCFDKRGTGQSTGEFDLSVTSSDFADDALAGINYLKTHQDINPNKIGIVGHSEGGLIASMVAAQSSDVAYMILLAAHVVVDIDALVNRSALQLHADGATQAMITHDRHVRKQVFSIVKNELNYSIAENRLRDVITAYWKQLPEEQKHEAVKLYFAFTPERMTRFIAMYNSPWFRYFFGDHGIAALKQITIPILALSGEFDWITPVSDLAIITSSLKQANNQDYTITVLPKLNHSFQTCQTGALAEYAIIEETFAPFALNTMTDWILKRISKQ
jgi:pimeloyl-ACP methyl ester carboxylesterase